MGIGVGWAGLGLGCMHGTGESAMDGADGMVLQVSSKYLDLTKKKLELTRLPHERPGEEADGGKSDLDGEEGGEELNGEGVVTKREIEGLVDYWYAPSV